MFILILSKNNGFTVLPPKCTDKLFTSFDSTPILDVGYHVLATEHLTELINFMNKTFSKARSGEVILRR